MANIIQSARAAEPIVEPAEEVSPADQYGQRPTRYEHEDIVLSNEHLAMVGKIDSVVSDVEASVAQLKEYANALTQALRERVIDLTVLVEREKAVVSDLQAAFSEMHARVMEKPIGGSFAGNGPAAPHDSEARAA